MEQKDIQVSLARRMVFGLDPVVVLICFLLPLFLFYVRSFIPLYVLYSGICMSFVAQAIWYWQMNKAITDFVGKMKGLDILVYIFIILTVSNNMLFFMSRKIYVEQIEVLRNYDILSIRFLLAKLNILFSCILAIVMTIRTKKFLTERTTWFLFLEWLIPLIAIFNITPLFKEELKSRNYL